MKLLLRFSLLFLCLAGLASLAQGQVLVSGRVINGTTDEPIPGLTVILLDESGQSFPLEQGERNVTSLEGQFMISDVLPDVWYTIEVYSGKALRFTDYVFVDGSNVFSGSEGQDVIELPDIIVDY